MCVRIGVSFEEGLMTSQSCEDQRLMGELVAWWDAGGKVGCGNWAGERFPKCTGCCG